MAEEYSRFPTGFAYPLSSGIHYSVDPTSSIATLSRLYCVRGIVIGLHSTRLTTRSAGARELMLA